MEIKEPKGRLLELKALHFLHLLCIIFFVFSSFAVSAQKPAFSPNEFVMGTNLDGIGYYHSSYPFVDILKCGERWKVDPLEDPGVQTVFYDDNGYPLALENGKTVASSVFVNANFDYPLGDYVLTWEGDGDVVLVGSYRVQLVSEDLSGTVKRRVYNVSDRDKSDFLVRINSTNPDNRVRDMHLWLPGFENATSIFTPQLIESLQPFSYIRFMDWNTTNNSEQGDWSKRKPKSYVFQSNTTNSKQRPEYLGGSVKMLSGGGSVAFEYLIDLCNETNKDLWICIPHMADDNFVQNLSTLIKDNLDPELNVYIEYSNEIWNPMFSQHQWTYDKAATDPSVNHPKWVGRRHAQIFNIFEASFGGTSRLIRVLGGRNTSASYTDDLMTGALMVGDFDAVATTTYYNDNVSDNLVLPSLNYRNPTEADYNAAIDYVIESVSPGTDNTWERWKTFIETVNQRGYPVITYEGGNHISALGGNEQISDLVDFLHNLNRHPRAYEMYHAALNNFRALGGCTHSVFVLCGSWNKYGSWGHKEYWNQPLDEAVNYKAAADYAAMTSTIDQVAPSTPTNVQAVDVHSTACSVQWDEVTDNSGFVVYEVWVDEDKYAYTNKLDFFIDGLSSSTEYTITIKAKDASHNISEASISITTKAPDNQNPAPPAEVSHTNLGGGSLLLSWSEGVDNEGVVEYEVFQNDVLIANSSDTQTRITGLSSGTDYSFTIKSVDITGNKSDASVAYIIQPIAGLDLKIIDNVDAGAVFSGTWNTSSSTMAGVIGDSYTHNNKTTGSDIVVTYSPGITNTAYYDISTSFSESVYRDAGVPYVISHVAGVDTVIVNQTGESPTFLGNFELSSSSFVKILTENTTNYVIADAVVFEQTPPDDNTAPSTPANLVSSDVQATSVQLGWTASTDNYLVATYKIYANGILAGTSISNSTSITGLESGTSYDFTVVAVDAAGNISASSNAITETTSGDTNPTYTLTVTNGTGDGGYSEGAAVNIVADAAPEGMEFDHWTGDVANVINVNDPSTSITMPAGNITITAGYKMVVPDGQTTVLNPVADAYVRGGSYADVNYGTESTLWVKTHASNDDYTRESALRFDVSGITGNISEAKLRLYVNSASGASVHSVYLVNNDNWTESGIKYSNKPITSDLLGLISVNNPGGYVEIDITTAVSDQTDGLLSLMVVSNDEAYIGYDSREGINQPELVILQSDISVDGVTLDQTSATIEAGQTLQLTETVSPVEATDKSVVWSSNNEAVASVDANGLVTSVSAGNATITVTTNDGGFTANCAVTVNAIPPHSTTLNPIEDAYVRGGNYADGNFGSETTLFVKTHNTDDAFTRESLLKFDIDGIESVSVATLRLFVNYSNGSSSHTLYSVNDDTWTEMDVDYANKPSYGAAISTYAVSNTGMYIEIDVTAAIQNETDGTLSLAVVANDETYVGYDSREAQNKPELIVVHSGLKSLVIADETSKKENSVRIFPNPVTNGYFTVDLGGIINAEVQIFNANGQIVYQNNNVSNAITIESDNFNKGLYIAKIISENQISLKKFIVR